MLAVTLPVMEHFYTLQGEGFNTGKASYFIRLGGCDVGCHWCDVKESWNANLHTNYTIPQIVKWVAAANALNVVITGGEPCMYDLTELTTELKKNNCTICIETSGAYPITGIIDWICVSPKKFKAPLKESLLLANELKVVVFNTHDFKWATDNFKHCNPTCIGYLQPEWQKANETHSLIIDFIKLNPTWRLSLQTHKYLNIP